MDDRTISAQANKQAADASMSVTHWIEQAREGDDAAAQALWERYFHRLVALARNKLAGSPTRAEDEEDVALCALNSFFEGARKGRFPLLKDRHGLWPLLAKITERKALNLREKSRAKKRGSGLVRGESAFIQARHDDFGPGIENAPDLGPDDEFAAGMNELCNDLMSKLQGDESLMKIARLKLEGYTNAEIAEKLGRVSRTIERKLELIRSLWSQADKSG